MFRMIERSRRKGARIPQEISTKELRVTVAWATIISNELLFDLLCPIIGECLFGTGLYMPVYSLNMQD